MMLAIFSAKHEYSKQYHSLFSLIFQTPYPRISNHNPWNNLSAYLENHFCAELGTKTVTVAIGDSSLETEKDHFLTGLA
jgi:hypothetical protein